MTMPVVERERERVLERESDEEEEEEGMSSVCYFVTEESVERKEKGNKCEVCLYLVA